MSVDNNYSGFAIAVAWPETYCKQAGSWYDGILFSLGFSQHHYYKVGHAALVLINSEDNQCFYYDFGRYHTPFQYGRVRSAVTDNGLKVNTRAIISKDGSKIENINDILTELQLNSECHGEGTLYASYCKIDFAKASCEVLKLQEQSPIPYGPFRYKGSNCSRFVNTAILAGNPKWKYSLRLKYLMWFTPSPIGNVNSLPGRIATPKLLKTQAFCPAPLKDKRKLKTTLEQPPKPKKVSDTAQWLSGEGAGSWFTIEHGQENYQIQRFNPDGDLECSGSFKTLNNEIFDISLPYQFDYLSHCQKVTIIQKDRAIVMNRISGAGK